MEFRILTLIAPKHSEEYSQLILETDSLSDVFKTLHESAEAECEHQKSILPYESWVMGWAVETRVGVIIYGPDIAGSVSPKYKKCISTAEFARIYPEVEYC